MMFLLLLFQLFIPQRRRRRPPPPQPLKQSQKNTIQQMNLRSSVDSETCNRYAKEGQHGQSKKASTDDHYDDCGGLADHHDTHPSRRAE
jgi:hypothetical protein